MTAYGVRRAKAALFSGCKAHPATAPAGAAKEVTNWLKPSECVSRIGDSASVQAATRVNAEQDPPGLIRSWEMTGLRCCIR